MELDALHHSVKEALSSLDLNGIWPGFTPLRFALYDDRICCFDGRYIEKTADFCANTSILYQGEQIAIWKVQEDLEIPVLTSKIVHEMFHGFQTQRGWDCWPKETAALYRYEYRTGNLSLKLRENELLLALLDRFDAVAFRELLAHRRLRSERFPYEFSYESRVEEIEGTANYVEWQALKQLDPQSAAALTDRMHGLMTKPEALFPIRIPCYFTGALMIHALRSAGIYDFDPPARPAIGPLLEKTAPSDGGFPGKETQDRRVSAAIAAFESETEAIVRAALERNEVVLTGPFELVSVNVYNARRWNEYLTSTYFLMYRSEEGDRMIPGNFVIRMQDEKTIAAVYRWN